jgi:hypothetical protein
MSYIRMGQDSQYVPLHGGSRAYIYGDGSKIQGIGSYGAFVDALCIHAEQAGFPEEDVDVLQTELERHYGEPRKTEYDGAPATIGPKAEMAHIVAQHLDSRLDSLLLTERHLRMLRRYAEESFTACPDCGDLHRPDVYTPDEQGELCMECYEQKLRQMGVTADVSELEEYVEETLPDRVPPEEFHDDEFYALCSEVWMDRESNVERQALNFILGDAADEVMDAMHEDRPVNKEAMLLILDQVSDE